jgi:hypothetical protein
MKRIAFYSAIIIVIAVCALLLFRKHEKPPNPSAETPQPVASHVAREPQPAQSTPVPSVSGPSSHQAGQGQPPPANHSAAERIAALSNAFQAYSVQLHRPISFYGKVVDENDRPIEGANIEFVWAHFSPLPEGTSSTNSLSNLQGLFSLTGVTGAKLGVHVCKDGYYYERSVNLDQFTYSATFGSTPFQPDSNNPVIFHLRKKE